MFFHTQTLKNSISVKGLGSFKDYSCFASASGSGFLGMSVCGSKFNKNKSIQGFKDFQAGGAASRACRTGPCVYKFKVSVNTELLAFYTTFNLKVQATQDVNSSNNSQMILAAFVSLHDSSLLSSPWLMLDRNSAPSLSHPLLSIYSNISFQLQYSYFILHQFSYETWPKSFSCVQVLDLSPPLRASPSTSCPQSGLIIMTSN